MRTAASLGGQDVTNIEMAAYYAEAGGWLLNALIDLGHNDDARRVGADAGAVADKVLELRPGYILALHAQELILDSLAGLARNDMRPAEAVTLGKRAVGVSHTLIKFDPNNIISFSNWSVALVRLGDASWQAGKLRESLEYDRQGLEAVRHAAKGGASFVLNNLLFPTIIMAIRQADLGDTAAVDATLATAAQEIAHLRQSEPNSRTLPLFGECLLKGGESNAALSRGDPTTARRASQKCLGSMQSVTAHGALQEFWRTASMFFAVDQTGQAAYMLGDFAAAERNMRTALELHKQWPTDAVDDRRDAARVSTLLAMALAREGHAADAREVINPVVKFHRELAARNHGDEWQHVELASALYAQALADKRQRPALLKEAAALIAGVPAEMRDLHSVRLWRDRIREELHARAAAVARDAAPRVAA
jgi:tetratricopeptide (TPR) repeat protein